MNLVGRTTVRSHAAAIGRGLKPIDVMNPKPNSNSGENKNKNICKILWTILQYEIIFYFLFDSKNLKFEIYPSFCVGANIFRENLGEFL
jgi:hypothetical protein